LAWRARRAAFPRDAATVAPLDLVAPAGVAGAEAAAPPARGVAAVEPLALGAPVIPGAPPSRKDPAAGLPDLAVADAGVPHGASVARPALGEAIASVGATAVDRKEAIATAPWYVGRRGGWKWGEERTAHRGTRGTPHSSSGGGGR